VSGNQRKGEERNGDRRAARLDEALRLLAGEARQRLARLPSGHLASFEGEEVELTLRLPVGSAGLAPELAAAIGSDLDGAVAALVTHRAAFRPGAVYCLRCQAADCEHAEPGGPREVFAGWGKTGLPHFVDFPTLLLERGDPRVDLLYDGRPALLAHTVHAGDLTAELIDAYRDNPAGYRLHGQVAAGWWKVPGPDGHQHPVAVTLQVVSTRPQGVPRRYGVNLIGRGPDDEPLENVYDRLGELPWSAALRWAQEAVESVGRTAKGKPKGGKEKEQAKGKAKAGGGQQVERRLHGILDGLARRLEKKHRADDRKTGHARERHKQGDRPTHMALADLARAGNDDVLVDRRQETLVVLGDKGRAHVFNPEGKLVTSIRYAPEAIERRKKKDVWRPASAAEVAALKGSVEGIG
jgi:hypothetical protein